MATNLRYFQEQHHTVWYLHNIILSRQIFELLLCELVYLANKLCCELLKSSLQSVDLLASISSMANWLSVWLYGWKNDAITPKSSLPPGFCMINRHLSLYISKKALVHMIFCVWTRYASAQSFLEKISPCFMVTNSEYQASPHGEGTGDEARLKIMWSA